MARNSPHAEQKRRDAQGYAHRDLTLRERMLVELFDRQWYVSTYPDVVASGVDPLVHFLEFGLHEGRAPNPFFDISWYAARYPDVNGPLHALQHYLQVGGAELRQPHPNFDPTFYVEQHPEAAPSPLLHYLRVGRNHGWPVERPDTSVIESREEKDQYNAKGLSRTAELPSAPGVEKDFETMPGDFGPTKQEILQPTADALAQALAQYSGTSVDDARTLVKALSVDAPAVIEASKKLLKPKSRFFTRSDFSDEELNDQQKIDAAKTTVNSHRRDRIEDLDEKTAYELRRATALLRYSRYQPRIRHGCPDPQ
jgi:hypothetical protein